MALPFTKVNWTNLFNLFKEKMRKKTSYIVWGAMLLFILWGGFSMLYLKYYGSETKGIILSKYIVGTKGRTECVYTYTVSNKIYEAEVQYDNLEVGDTIIVLYTPFYPQISTLKKMVLEYYW